MRNNSFQIYDVRNIQARNNLQSMRIRDKVLFYHSQKELQVRGIMEVVKEAHQDPTTKDARWVSVSFKPIDSFIKPVTLKQIKGNPLLKNIGLIKQPRLSVMRLTKSEFDEIIKASRC